MYWVVFDLALSAQYLCYYFFYLNLGRSVILTLDWAEVACLIEIGDTFSGCTDERMDGHTSVPILHNVSTAEVYIPTKCPLCSSSDV